jgi:hypothetical protein
VKVAYVSKLYHHTEVWDPTLTGGPKREEVTGGGENYIIRGFISCTPTNIIVVSNRG